MNNRFLFTYRYKIPLFVLMAAGIAALIARFVSAGADDRFWANILLNNYYFMALSLGAVFFVTVHTISESGWHTSVQRIPEAMGSFLFISGILFLLLFVFGSHSIYHWTHKEALDPVLQGKTAYLNMPFFMIRFLVYFAGWMIFFYS